MVGCFASRPRSLPLGFSGVTDGADVLEVVVDAVVFAGADCPSPEACTKVGSSVAVDSCASFSASALLFSSGVRVQEG